MKKEDSMQKVELRGKTILVTGAAGFIGANLVKRLFIDAKNAMIIGIDNMNDYYDVRLKEYRLETLNIEHGALNNNGNTNPDAYIMSNMIGFYNILEACRHNPVEHLVYASSSSVYGGNKKVPFSTDDRVDNPVSLYAATKKSNELFAHCYSKLYDMHQIVEKALKNAEKWIKLKY